MDLHSYPRTMKDVLTLKRKYVIPRFQREYSWGEEEIDELWDDILDNIFFDNGSLQNSDYFFGALVLVGDDSTDSVFQVVDGQQRLTTITVLFSAITEVFKSGGFTDLMEGTYRYILGKDDDNKPYHILENENPKPYFQLKIQDLNKTSPIEPSSHEEERLQNTYDYFLKKLKYESLSVEFSKKTGSVTLSHDQLMKAIRDQVLRFKTIYITVASLDDAYLIFETLNAKGKDLEPLDLVKNKIFYVLKNDKPIDEAKEKWTRMRKNLQNRDIRIPTTNFFRHFWLSRYAFTTDSKLYDSFCKKMPQVEREYMQLLDQLTLSSLTYSQLLNPLDSDWPQQEEKFAIDVLNSFKLFNVIQVNTILLSIVEARKANQISLAYFKKVLHALECFHFIFTAVSSARASGLESKYSKYARFLRNAPDKNAKHKVIDELIKELREKMPSRSTFIDRFINIYYTKDYTAEKRLIQYIFKRVEENLQNTDELKINIISIEHVMPESTGNPIVGYIGNLIPLDKKINSDIGDAPFREKMKMFETSSLETVKGFVKDYMGNTDWEESDISKRSLMIAEYALDSVWKF